MTSDGKRKLDKFKWANALCDARGIGMTHKTVGFCWLTYASTATGQAWPSQTTIAERLGCSESHVSRAFRALKKAGFMYVAVEGGNTGKRSGSNVVQFTMPQPPAQLTGVNDLTPGSADGGYDEATPGPDASNPQPSSRVTPSPSDALIGNEEIKEQITSRNHLGAGQSPSEPREDDTANRDTSASAPHVPQPSVFSFKDSKANTLHDCGGEGCDALIPAETFNRNGGLCDPCHAYETSH